MVMLLNFLVQVIIMSLFFCIRPLVSFVWFSQYFCIKLLAGNIWQCS